MGGRRGGVGDSAKCERGGGGGGGCRGSQHSLLDGSSTTATGMYPEIDGGGCRTDSAREKFLQPRPLSSIV